jgi:hypothetical protein
MKLVILPSLSKQNTAETVMPRSVSVERALLASMASHFTLSLTREDGNYLPSGLGRMAPDCLSRTKATRCLPMIPV